MKLKRKKNCRTFNTLSTSKCECDERRSWLCRTTASRDNGDTITHRHDLKVLVWSTLCPEAEWRFCCCCCHSSHCECATVAVCGTVDVGTSPVFRTGHDSIRSYENTRTSRTWKKRSETKHCAWFMCTQRQTVSRSFNMSLSGFLFDGTKNNG